MSFAYDDLPASFGAASRAVTVLPSRSGGGGTSSRDRPQSPKRFGRAKAESPPDAAQADLPQDPHERVGRTVDVRG